MINETFNHRNFNQSRECKSKHTESGAAAFFELSKTSMSPKFPLYH